MSVCRCQQSDRSPSLQAPLEILDLCTFPFRCANSDDCHDQASSLFYCEWSLLALQCVPTTCSGCCVTIRCILHTAACTCTLTFVRHWVLFTASLSYSIRQSFSGDLLVGLRHFEFSLPSMDQIGDQQIVVKVGVCIVILIVATQTLSKS